METAVKQSSTRTFPWAIALLLVIIGGTAGCAALKTGQSEEGRVRKIWQAREQYVALDPQDHPAGVAVAANDHPADLSVERLRSAFAAIEVHLSGKDIFVSLFNEPELEILSKKIKEGLIQARPEEDVTFAVIGQHSVLMGLMKERSITGGRVFCQDGRLNIIFGDLLRDVKENEDRRLFPFIAGSRVTTVGGTWTLASKPGSEPFTLKRQDWVQFPLASPQAAVAAPTPSNVPAPSFTPPAAPVNGVAPVDKSTEERLRTLDELHRKNLVTDEEYRAKRREILDGL